MSNPAFKRACPILLAGVFVSSFAAADEPAVMQSYRAANDFRCVALREAAALLVDGKPERARRILEKLSDPTTEPEIVSSGKAALGAWQRPSSPARAKRK